MHSFWEFLDCLDGAAWAVDCDAVIRAYGRTNWDAFARDNSCPNLAEPKAVIGRNLFDFITGDEVRAVYRGHLERLAKGAAAEVVLPYRCDAPDVGRDMRLAIKPMRIGDRLDGYLF